MTTAQAILIAAERASTDALVEALSQATAAGKALARESHHGRKCWIVTNAEYTVPSENVDALADARAATDAIPLAAQWLAEAGATPQETQP